MGVGIRLYQFDKRILVFRQGVGTPGYYERSYHYTTARAIRLINLFGDEE
jgi:hypothetical protein